MNMVQLNINSAFSLPEGFESLVLFDHEHVKVRRIELAAGARIPSCRMQEDVVFVVVAGRVTFHAEGEEALVLPPGAVFIPGGAVTRSMEAHEASLVLAVLCRREETTEAEENPALP